MNLERPTSSIGTHSRGSSTHCAFERRRTCGKATRLRPTAGGSPWSRSTAPLRSSANVVRRSPGAGAMRGLHALYVAGPRTVLHAFPRRHLRRGLPRIIPGERSISRVHGLGDAVVRGRKEFARHAPGWTPSGQDAYRLLPAATIWGIRDLLDNEPWRRGNGQQLPAARLDRLWAAGEVGEFASRLAPLARRCAPVPHRRTSHRAMAAS